MIDLKRPLTQFSGIAGLALAATLAACGGGGGGGGSSSPPAPVASVPAPIATPAITGVAAIGGLPMSNATIVFSCGCTGQAGTATADANGNYTLASSTTAQPAAPTPTYTTVPGRNYLAVMTAANGAQAWDITFLGSTPTHNHTLNATNTSDQYTTAAALFVFYNSITAVKADAFDTWDFTTIAAWVNAMQTSPIPAETALLNDIVAAEANHVSLYPSNGAAWVPPGTTPNVTIRADLDNVLSAAQAAGLTTRLPQQCDTTGIPCAVPTP